MEINQINGLSYYESGPADAPAILFLHGSPLSGRSWRPQLEGLKEFHCLAPDLPEHGLSASIAPFDMKDAVKRLADLVNQCAPNGRAHVVGLSFGGVVAQALLVQTPEMVDHTLLSGTSARGGKAFQNILKLYLAANKPLLALMPKGMISGLFRMQFGIPLEYSTEMEEDIQKVKMDAITRFISATYAEIETPSRAERPVLVVVGSKEAPAAKIMARRIFQAIKGSQGVIAPGAGHVWNLQMPELFNQLVRNWVSDQPLPPGFKRMEA